MAIERFTKDHEWIRVADGIGVAGITDYAQGQLGDITFVELPEIGRKVTQGDLVCAVDSVKTAAEVFAPASGEIIETNATLDGHWELVNEEAEGRAWFFKLRIANPAELDTLMDRAAYAAFVKESH